MLSTGTADRVDIIILVGKDSDGCDILSRAMIEYIEACKKQNLTYHIVGDAKTLIDDKELLTLPQANHLLVDAHGSIGYGGHGLSVTSEASQNSLNFIIKIQEIINCKIIIVPTCYGGAIINEAKKSQRRFQEGTMFFTPSSSYEPSLNGPSIRLALSFINKIQPGKLSPMTLLVRDAIKTITETMVFAIQPDNDNDDLTLRSITLSRTHRRIYFEAKAYCEFQLQCFNEFINTTLASTQINSLSSELENTFSNYKTYREKLGTDEQINLLPLNMGYDEETIYADASFWWHILHNDNEVLTTLHRDALVSSAILLSTAIEQSIRSDRDHLPNLIRFLFKQNSQINLRGQIANSMKWRDSIRLHNPQKEIVQEKSGYTALTYAVDRGASLGVIEALVDCGADPFHPDLAGRTAISLASDKYKKFFEGKCKESILKINKIKKFIDKLIQLQSEKPGEDILFPWYLSLDENMRKNFSDLLQKYDHLQTICHANNE